MSARPAAASPEALAKNPVAFLAAVSFINWFGYACWIGLLNNFAVEKAGFGWFETGVTQTIREIPGLLAFSAILWIAWFREQSFAYVSLLILGIGIAVTGMFPSFQGVLFTTFIMSVGFHYFEAANQSLQLQLLAKNSAPRAMGRITAIGSIAQFIGYGGLALCWYAGWKAYEQLYFYAGIICAGMVLAAWAYFGRFEGPVPQRKTIVIRRRYWLYYLLIFVSGARRQLTMAFGAFLLVKAFGYSVTGMALLMLAAAALNIFVAGPVGGMIARFGERRVMIMENIMLILIFGGYAAASDARAAGLLFILDSVLFTFLIAQRTYFQKIGDAADMAPTAALSFTINHIAAVIIPVVFGLLALIDYKIVFWLGVGIAFISLMLTLLIPRDPGPGNETVLQRGSRLQAA